MKLIDLQKQTATVTSAASITLGAVVGTFRTVVQAIAAGDLVASATGVSFFVRNPANGAYEVGEYTIGADGITLTQTKRTGSSNNGAAVAFGGVACEVYSAAPAATMNALLSAIDGIDVSTLSSLTSTAAGDAAIVLRGGNLYLMPTSLFGTASADTTPPVFVSAQVANSTPAVIQVTMSEPLGATAPPASALAVSKINGTAVAVSSVTTSGSVMLVTVASAFVSADTNIQVTYTKPANGNVLTDVASTPNAAASFGPSPVTNNVAAAATDTTKPTISGTTPAAVASATPTKVVITASEALDATYQPAASTFAVSGHVVSGVAVSGTTITLTVDTFVNGEAARTWTYAPNGTNNIRDLAGNQMDPVTTSQPITNNVAAAAQTDAQKYNVTVGVNYSTTATFSGGTAPNQYFTTGFNLYVKASDNSYPADGTIRFAWGKDPNTCPATFSAGAWSTSIPFAANGGNSSTVPNSVKPSVSVNPTSYPGLLAPNSSLYGGGSGGNYYPWILYADGSSKSFGTPVAVS